jgi:hypothetical protein
LRPVAASLAGAVLIACTAPAPAPRGTARAAPDATAGTSTTVTRAPTIMLPAPAVARDWTEYRLQAARRLVAANPGVTYLGTPPDVLLAIPVLEVELDADGSIRRIVVLRHPRQAKDTTQLAIDAVRRAAPFGDVSRLPRPWRFIETFLFNDQRQFKPRTLD